MDSTRKLNRLSSEKDLQNGKKSSEIPPLDLQRKWIKEKNIPSLDQPVEQNGEKLTKTRENESSSHATANHNQEHSHTTLEQDQPTSGEPAKDDAVLPDPILEKDELPPKLLEVHYRQNLEDKLKKIVDSVQDKEKENLQFDLDSLLLRQARKIYAFEYQKDNKFTIILTDDPDKAAERLKDHSKFNFTKESFDALRNSEVGTYFAVGKDLKVGEKLEDDNKAKARKKWGIIRQCAVDLELVGKIKEANKIRFDLPNGTSLNLVKKVKDAKNKEKVVWLIVHPNSSNEKNKKKSLLSRLFDHSSEET